MLYFCHIVKLTSSSTYQNLPASVHSVVSQTSKQIYLMRFFIAGRFIVLFLLLVCIFVDLGFGKTTIRGNVSDSSDGSPLIAATIQIQDTYRGTITNNDGEFDLQIPELPSVLVVRYIGYETQFVTISEPLDAPLIIKMKPTSAAMREIVVTGEDPALQIMREVIARKQIWRAALDTYVAEAYTRQRVENDTGIVSINESLSMAYWDKRRGTREVLKYRKQTQNVDPAQNFAAATLVPNFYDDDISIFGFTLVGVTHPNALSFYHFKLEGFRELDGKTVYDISVRPRRRLQPTFEGTIAILGEDYALLEVDLRPGESVMFPPPIQEFGLWYKQQFLNFGSDFWLPVDVRIEGSISIGFPGLQFPPIKFNQLSRLTNYEINVELPDSLYAIDRRLVVDTVAIASQTRTIQNSGISVPLDERESRAYENLDSTQTLEKAFKPTGALARFVDSDDEEREPSRFSKITGGLLDGFSPEVGFNRVDAFRIGAEYRIPYDGKLRSFLKGVYTTGVSDWDYGARVRYVTRNRSRLILDAGYQYNTSRRFEESHYAPFMSATTMLLGAPDYFDYFKSEEIKVNASFRLPRRLRWNIGIGESRYVSLLKETNYSIPGGVVQRENPSVIEGTDRTISLGVQSGSDRVPFGLTGGRTMELRVSHSAEWAGSDFNYTRLLALIDWRFETFYKRRFMPNTLDIRINAGTAIGELPLQKWHGLDGAKSYFSPFGSFRALRGLPYEGEHVLSLFWEHNFRTIPFELVGLQSIAKKGVGIILHGAHGYSDANSLIGYKPRITDGIHHEIGLSVNGIFSLMRIDTIYRLDKPGLFFGMSLARVF